MNLLVLHRRQDASLWFTADLDSTGTLPRRECMERPGGNERNRIRRSGEFLDGQLDILAITREPR